MILCKKVKNYLNEEFVVIKCSCGSTEFKYNNDGDIVCKSCGKSPNEEGECNG